MSDIPKSKRAHSNLEAHHQALAVRRMISVELLSSFAYSEKKLEVAIKKQTAHIQDPEHKKDVAEAIRSLENDYACWFIKRLAMSATTGMSATCVVRVGFIVEGKS